MFVLCTFASQIKAQLHQNKPMFFFLGMKYTWFHSKKPTAQGHRVFESGEIGVSCGSLKQNWHKSQAVELFCSVITITTSLLSCFSFLIQNCHCTGLPSLLSTLTLFNFQSWPMSVSCVVNESKWGRTCRKNIIMPSMPVLVLSLGQWMR